MGILRVQTRRRMGSGNPVLPTFVNMPLTGSGSWAVQVIVPFPNNPNYFNHNVPFTSPLVQIVNDPFIPGSLYGIPTAGNAVNSLAGNTLGGVVPTYPTSIQVLLCNKIYWMNTGFFGYFSSLPADGDWVYFTSCGSAFNTASQYFLGYWTKPGPNPVGSYTCRESINAGGTTKPPYPNLSVTL